MYEAVLVRAKPDETTRGCADCKHCKAAVSWWCTSERAIELSRTRLPGIVKCPYWEPTRTKAEVRPWEYLTAPFKIIWID